MKDDLDLETRNSLAALVSFHRRVTVKRPSARQMGAPCPPAPLELCRTDKLRLTAQPDKANEWQNGSLSENFSCNPSPTYPRPRPPPNHPACRQNAPAMKLQTGTVGREPKSPDTGSASGPKTSPTAPGDERVYAHPPPLPPRPKHPSQANPPTTTVTKIKKNLITKAKVKKQYAKIKAQRADTTTAPALPIPADELEATTTTPPPQVHPARQAILDDDGAAAAASKPAREPRGPRAPTKKAKDGDNSNLTELGPRVPTADRPEEEEAAEQPAPGKERLPHHRHNRPGYFAKQLAAGEKRRAEVEARVAEAARREAEMARRVAERERQRRAREKANAPGRDGKRKLGRQGGVLLDQVKRIVGGS
jgi:hypothetical protein